MRLTQLRSLTLEFERAVGADVYGQVSNLVQLTRLHFGGFSVGYMLFHLQVPISLDMIDSAKEIC